MTRTLEVALHIYDGARNGYPTDFGPATFTSPFGCTVESHEIISARSASIWMHVELSTWVPATEPDWLSASASLIDMNGWRIGTRPVLLYDRPYDVPTVTSFHLPEVHIALSIRRVS